VTFLYSRYLPGKSLNKSPKEGLWSVDWGWITSWIIYSFSLSNSLSLPSYLPFSLFLFPFSMRSLLSFLPFTIICYATSTLSYDTPYLSYATPLWATPHPSELRHNPSWTTSHPSELRHTSRNSVYLTTPFKWREWAFFDHPNLAGVNSYGLICLF